MMSEDGGAAWLVRMTHKRAADDASVAYTHLWRPFPTRQKAELWAQCWWSTGYGRRGVVAIHVRPDGLGRAPVEMDWLPVSPGAKEACYLLGAARPRTDPPGTLRLVLPLEIRDDGTVVPLETSSPGQP